MPPSLPTHRLAIARAFHRVKSNSRPSPARSLSTTITRAKWEGSSSGDHVAREGDKHNVQHDAVREGKAERAKGEEGNSKATTETSGGQNKKAKEEFPEAPDTIGMQDERGGKGT